MQALYRNQGGIGIILCALSRICIKNNYGNCGGYQEAGIQPALIQSDDLPDTLKATLAEVSSSFGLSVSGSYGEPELTSSVDSLTRKIVSSVGVVANPSYSTLMPALSPSLFALGQAGADNKPLLTEEDQD